MNRTRPRLALRGTKQNFDDHDASERHRRMLIPEHLDVSCHVTMSVCVAERRGLGGQCLGFNETMATSPPRDAFTVDGVLGMLVIR